MDVVGFTEDVLDPSKANEVTTNTVLTKHNLQPGLNLGYNGDDPSPRSQMAKAHKENW